MPDPLLIINQLGISFFSDSQAQTVVSDVSFQLHPGKTLALVGESGSGKSLTALSVMGLLPPQAQLAPGSQIHLNGTPLLEKTETEMEAIRGHEIGMIFQEPLTALNPLHTIGKQIAEPLAIHTSLRRNAIQNRVLQLLERVGLSALKDRLGAYPHELSGGQRQRVMIAMALANNPALLIADEPTTALDVTVQAQILDLLKDLQAQMKMGLLLITHDLPVVQSMADYVCVMESGVIVEHGPVTQIFVSPKHPYTQRLLSAQFLGPATRPTGKDGPPILEGQGIKVHFPQNKTLFGNVKSWVKAVDGIDIVVKRGHTLGIVGESGSGKSTLGLALLQLIKAEGAVYVAEKPLASLGRSEMKSLRADLQIVFQDPFAALSPRMSIGQIIEEGLRLHRPNLTAASRDAIVVETLQRVQMDPETRHRYPHEFSGGQRQRIAIARALILDPKILILDEPTSALDVSVQADVVQLLRDLQRENGLTYVFISHDLRVVQALAHDVLVMRAGTVVESGPAERLFSSPKHPYTQNLLRAAMIEAS